MLLLKCESGDDNFIIFIYVFYILNMFILLRVYAMMVYAVF